MDATTCTMSVQGQDHKNSSPDSFVGIDREYVARMLANMGVDLTHTLAPSMILGSFDVMASAELAVNLPEDANFEAVLQCFHTLKHVQPPDVRNVQVRVLDVVRRLCAPMSDARYEAIRGRLQFSGFIPAV